MRVNSIRKKFTCLGDAIQYATTKGWKGSATEKAIEDEMEWVDIYKFLCQLRDRSNAYLDGDKNVDYLYTLSRLHIELVETLQEIHRLYLSFYRYMPNFPPGEIISEVERNYIQTHKTMADSLLFKVGNLYNRIKVVRKILIDKGYTAPSIPKETLILFRRIIQGYPQDFVDLK